MLGALGLILFGVLVGGSGLLLYWDLPSMLIVVLGSWFCFMNASSIKDAIEIFKIIGMTFKAQNFGEKNLIQKLMAMSEKARREGLLSLEDEIADLDNAFMKRGLQLVVDGTDQNVVRELMESEVTQMQNRHASVVSNLNMWAALAPGFGMLGTVIGLIAMLKNLEDKASVGPNMAIALITTLYGSMIANWLLTPTMGKLMAMDAREANVNEMVIEGVLSIQAGDNPRILGMKLLTYLNPADKKAIEGEVIKDS
jgi:chemotaxis protein MotA